MTSHAPKNVINEKAVTDFANSQRAFNISQDETAIELASAVEISRGENVILAEMTRVQNVLRKKEIKIAELQAELSNRDSRAGMAELNEYIADEYGAPAPYSENVLAFFNPDGSRIKA